jgi:hypothetical protein
MPFMMKLPVLIQKEKVLSEKSSSEPSCKTLTYQSENTILSQLIKSPA